MKFRNILLIITISGTIMYGVTACGSSKNDPDYQFTETYKGDKLILNGEEASKDVSVKIETNIEGTSATLILNNIVVGEPALPMTVNYSHRSGVIDGINTNTDRKITIEGTISDGKLTTTITTEILSPTVGVWNLRKTEYEDNGVMHPMADVIVNIDSDNSIPSFSDAIISEIARRYLGSALLGSVKIVSIDFKKDGNLAILYEKVEEGTEFWEDIFKNIEWKYYVKSSENKIFIAVDKALLDLLTKSVKETPDPDAGLLAILDLFEDAGNYYALTINIDIKDNYNQLYLDKNDMVKIIDISKKLGLFEEGAPLAEYATYLELTNAIKSIKFGLGFEK